VQGVGFRADLVLVRRVERALLSGLRLLLLLLAVRVLHERGEGVQVVDQVHQNLWLGCSIYFSEICSGSEEGSYLRLIDFV